MAADRVRRVRGVRVVVRRGAGAVLPGAGEERRRAGPGGRRANPEAERGTPQRRPRGSLGGPGARRVAFAGFFVSSRPAIAAIGGRGSMRVRGRVVGGTRRFRVRHRRGSAAEGDPRRGLGAFDASPRGVGDDHGDGVGAARGKLRRRRERGGEGRGPGSVRSPSRVARRSARRSRAARVARSDARRDGSGLEGSPPRGSSGGRSSANPSAPRYVSTAPSLRVGNAPANTSATPGADPRGGGFRRAGRMAFESYDGSGGVTPYPPTRRFLAGAGSSVGTDAPRGPDAPRAGRRGGRGRGSL